MREKTTWARQKPVHANKPLIADPAHEVDLAAHLLETLGRPGLVELYGRFCTGTGLFDGLMRRVIWRGLARRFGNGVTISAGAQFRHLERIEIGNNVFFGEQSIIQGRFDGTCRIGDRVWIGPQAHLDARDLHIEERAGIGVGVRIVGAEHAGEPFHLNVDATDMLVGPVVIGKGAGVSTGATILPGVTIGADAWIGAGAVVTKDIPERAVAVGVPARVVRVRPTGEAAPSSDETADGHKG